jgi:hypothetical protein
VRASAAGWAAALSCSLDACRSARRNPGACPSDGGTRRHRSRTDRTSLVRSRHCRGPADTLVHRHSGQGHDDVCENAAADTRRRVAGGALDRAEAALGDPNSDRFNKHPSMTPVRVRLLRAAVHSPKPAIDPYSPFSPAASHLSSSGAMLRTSDCAIRSITGHVSPLSAIPRRRARYTALRKRGHSHGRALRSVADRLLALACVLLQRQTLFDPHTTATAHLPGPQNPGECHLYFAEGCHLYIAPTKP